MVLGPTMNEQVVTRKDFLGEDFQVGDYVLCVDFRSGARLLISKVTEIVLNTIYVNNRDTGTFETWPNRVCKMHPDQLTMYLLKKPL